MAKTNCKYSFFVSNLFVVTNWILTNWIDLLFKSCSNFCILSFYCFYSWHNVLVNPFSGIPQVYFEINYHHSELFLIIDPMFVVLGVTTVFQSISPLVIIRYTERASIIFRWLIIIPRFGLNYWSHSFLTFVLTQYFKWCHDV